MRLELIDFVEKRRTPEQIVDRLAEMVLCGWEQVVVDNQERAEGA